MMSETTPSVFHGFKEVKISYYLKFEINKVKLKFILLQEITNESQ